jgi:hypothetical protein
MSTLNNVFKKLEHTDKVSQVNLESQKVELGFVDDFVALFSKANENDKIISQSLIKSLTKSQTDYKTNLQTLQQCKKIADTLIVKSKELGIDLPSNVLNLIKLIDVVIKDTQDSIFKIEQMY